MFEHLNKSYSQVQAPGRNAAGWQAGGSGQIYFMSGTLEI
jgi:hypothetical protein